MVERRDIVQGTHEWDEIRLGKISGTGLGELMSDPRSKAAKDAGELSSTAVNYLLKKVSERIIGYGRSSFDLPAFDWGHKHEPEARTYYEILNAYPDGHVYEVGFVELNEWVGVSPDALVGTDGGLEIKCPYNNDVHLKYLQIESPQDLFAVEKKYYWQVQQNLFVTGRKWWDWMTYDPRMSGNARYNIVRFERDEDLMSEIEKRLERAISFVQSKLVELV